MEITQTADNSGSAGRPHEPMVLQIFYKGVTTEIEADLLGDWNFNQNASRDCIAERILNWVTNLEPEWESI